MAYNVTRKAILIGCPGNRPNFLQGVKRDVNNINGTLFSDKGGRWYEDEIVILPNPSLEELMCVVDNTYADYVFIYFSGHGYTNEAGERMISLRDCSVSDTILLNDSPRQMIIIDACRNYLAPGIAGVPIWGEPEEHFDGYYEAREVFDRYIAFSPYGKIIVHATQEGKYSYDSAKGGYFTRALLHLSTRLKLNSQVYVPLHIKKLLNYIPDYLQRVNNSQIPSIAYEAGNLTVPFALVVPQPEFPKIKLRQPQRPLATAETNSSNAGWWAFGLALLVIGIAAAGSSE